MSSFNGNGRRRVVITGLGVVCPLGIGREPFWQALLAGQSGVGQIAEFAGSDLPFQFAGLLHLNRRSNRIIPKPAYFAFRTAALKLER